MTFCFVISLGEGKFEAILSAGVCILQAYIKAVAAQAELSWEVLQLRREHTGIML